MKYFILFFSCVVALISCQSSYEKEWLLVESNAIAYSQQIENFSVENENDELIKSNDYQNLIKAAFAKAFVNENTHYLDSLDSFFSEKIEKNNQLNILVYWKSLTNLYKSIYLDTNDKSAEAEKVLFEAMEELSSLKNKNSEDYALLAYMNSFYIKFIDSTPKVIAKSNEAKKYAEFSIRLDQSNPRPYYVLASLDFYTPVKYGGGKTVEKDLKKVLSLPSQKTPNIALPSWGHEEAYEMLISYYLREDRKDEAKSIFKEAIAKFPDNYTLKSLAVELID